MSEIKINAVSAHKDKCELLGWSIDSPVPGVINGSTSFEVRGWVLSSKGPVRAVEIRNPCDSFATGKVSKQRPDVATSFPSITHAALAGFSVPVGIIGLPSPFELDVVSVLSDGMRIPFARISGHHRLATDQFQPTIRPLMVTTWGRMGTTWFLRILREHPEIVVHGPYPYETRAAVYWAHMLKVLAEPSSTIEEFHVDGAKVGRHPVNALHPTERYLHEWFASDYAHDLTLLSATSIDRFYSSVAKAIGRPEARYFAEKVLPTHGPRVLWSLYPDAKEIILIRDLRDVVCSIRAFNAQRGFAAFGEEHAKNDAEFIEFLRSAAFRLMAAWRERSSRALLLRYEDLILSPVESIQKVLGYLELDASAQVAQELLAAAEVASSSMRGHVTAGTPEASVGRWRRDLDPSLAELCQQAFEEILKTFDYPIALDKTHAPV